MVGSGHGKEAEGGVGGRKEEGEESRAGEVGREEGMEGRERKRERKTGETVRARERQDESKKVLETEKSDGDKQSNRNLF